jgi:hypothetical protein
MKKVGVAILGLGVVGGGTYKILTDNKEYFKKTQKLDITVENVLEKSQERIASLGIPQEIVASGIEEVVTNPNVDVVVEVIGGIEPARTFVLKALKSGKSVVTSNKELICKHWYELEAEAKKSNAGLYFEASCVGGVPIIRTLNDGTQANNISSIVGIINGTTNYILTKMEACGSSYQDALKEAQSLGYAEFNPTADVEGFEVADFGFDIDTSQVSSPSMNDTMREQMKKRKQWGKDKDYTEPVCNLADMVEIHALRGYRYIHSFKTGTEGAPLSEIKKPESVGLFADKAADLIRSTIGLKQTDGWCIITTPKRRHKEQNFASMVCAELSRMLGIPFHDDVVEAKNRARIDPVFTIVKSVSERNIIIYDDILTGGTTLYTTANLFPDRNLLLIVGINNHR